MTRQPVTSSNIKSLGWEPYGALNGDRSFGALEVEFASGTVYRYTGVLRVTFDAILCAPSIGRAFSQLVRQHVPPYAYEKVAP